jgi:hypothetical protein
MICDLNNENDYYNILLFIDYSFVSKKTIEVKEYKAKRSNLQNRFYWAILNFIQQETGNDKDTLHEFFKHQFLSKKRYEVFGIEFDAEVSTTKLDKKEFTGYIEMIRIFAAQELEFNIPDMSDKDFENFLKHYECYL